MSHHLITLMVFLPFIGAMLQAFVPSSGKGAPLSGSSWVALGASLASSLCGIGLVVSMHGQVEPQASEVLPWIGSFAISYEMALDGLNVLLVLLIAIIFPLLIASEWNRKDGVRGMHGLLLVIQASLAGAVCAQDLFLLFFFWALSTLPFYFLIGIWGSGNRESAAFRSVIASSLGNALFFAALILIYYSVDPHTFSLKDLAGGRLEKETFKFLGSQLPVSTVAFALIGAGLALRAPIWPLHGWFTRVAEEAPASVFVSLSAVSVPVATYIFVKLSYSLFPATVAQMANGIVIVGAINLVMGGVCAIAQRGLKKLLAYVCLSEVGLILIGIGSLSSAGVVGAIYQELSLGLGLAGFGLFAGIMVDRTGKTRFLTDTGGPGFGGIAIQAPTMALVAGVVTTSLLGFPGMSGFVGHALLMIGSYSVHPGAVILAGGAMVLATYYLFTMYRYVFLGKVGAEVQSFTDLTLWERAYLLPLVGFLLLFGLYPKPLLELVRPTVLTLLSTIK
jgi:NADH-quinone oxidoreductase subunit M